MKHGTTEWDDKKVAAVLVPDQAQVQQSPVKITAVGIRITLVSSFLGSTTTRSSWWNLNHEFHHYHDANQFICQTRDSDGHG
mmetsp:Transcript_19805/g.49938  ORF Transcript_19805/g.49938 Transcript_19805/m.49938 type:complete len:82 (-) Transcript_19805:1413-1658(-)